MSDSGSEIRMVYGTQRTIRRAIDALVAARKPVFDVSYKRTNLFWYIATIKTDKPHDMAL